MERIKTSITMRRDIKEEAEEVVDKGLIPGVTSFSGFIEYALRDTLSRVKA